MRLLFNDSVEDDLVHILAFIDQFAEGAEIHGVEVEPRLIEAVLRGMRQDFPCAQGLEKASVFKKVANFILYFVAEQPIVKPFPTEAVGADLAAIPNHQNGIVAFNIAINALEGAEIHHDDGPVRLVNKIRVSSHSYVDIVDAISRSSPQAGYLLLTVLLEQLAYKTNPDCQYTLLDL